MLKIFGGKKDPLEADLNKVTDLGVIDVPKDYLSVIVEKARESEETRRTIMRHVQDRLAGKAQVWKQMYAAMVLIDTLLEQGPPELVSEASQGRHPDLMQRLSMLESFEYPSDRRIQGMIRNKAQSVRSSMMRKLEGAPDSMGELPAELPAKQPAPASCSPASEASTSTASTAFFRDSSEPEGQMILNGIVAVGHRDDTTSEEEEEDSSNRKPVAYRKPVPRQPHEAPESSPPPSSAAYTSSLLDL